MELLQLISHIRCPILDKIMLFFTYLGDETAFLVIALIMFWCVDKRKGYFILSVGFLGTLLNQFMKLWFRIPRPWHFDENIAPMRESVGADGYSFPSGHSQNSVGTFGGIAAVVKNKIIKILCIVVCVMVPFSRMYFGVHTPQDVLVGAGMAILLIVVLKPLLLGKHEKIFPVFLAIMTVLAVSYLCFAEFYHFPEDIIEDAYNSGLKNAYTLLGALLGFLVVYPIEKKWIGFTEKAEWWVQLLKVGLGLIVVLAVKEGLRVPLGFIAGELPGRLLRYFLLVIVAGLLWPLTFKRFVSFGKKAQS